MSDYLDFRYPITWISGDLSGSRILGMRRLRAAGDGRDGREKDGYSKQPVAVHVGGVGRDDVIQGES